MLLGLDFLKTHKAVINLDKEQLHLAQNVVPMNVEVDRDDGDEETKRAVIVRRSAPVPYSQTVIDVECTGSQLEPWKYLFQAVDPTDPSTFRQL